MDRTFEVDVMTDSGWHLIGEPDQLVLTKRATEDGYEITEAQFKMPNFTLDPDVDVRLRNVLDGVSRVMFEGKPGVL